ncbi:MAG: S41 family peptidase [Tahibacter sp.]
MKRIRKKTIAIAAVLGGTVFGGLALALHGMPGGGPPGPPQKDMPVDAAMRAEAIDSVIARMNRHYVFPDKAAALETRLRALAQSGEFDRVTSAEAFAETLTKTLQRELSDKHVGVRYSEKIIPEMTNDNEQSADDEAAERIEQVRFNFGVSGFNRLRGNIGYVDLHQFGRPGGTAERYAGVMALLVDTAALIVDLRKCDGGDPESVMLFASYLYDKPTHLNDIYWRDENRTDVRWTTEQVAGKKYGETRKVYLLTSEDTFSGCEDLAYALKNNHRATVIGETTGGGAHAGDPQRVSAHFQMFVPGGRPINPVTHTDWEGTGVTPDIPTSQSKALDVAQITALKAMVAAESDAEWKARLQRRIDELE